MSSRQFTGASTASMAIDVENRTPSLTRDLLELTKPGIITMCLASAAAGIGLAPGPVSVLLILATFLGTAFAVGSANAFNMVLERDTDRLMERTKNRPIAAGRLSPRTGVALGLSLGVCGLTILAVAVNPLSALLAALALNTYVLLYTPLKRRSSIAMFLGAIPGAIPTLIGWTAVTGHIALPGIVLFLVLVLWQMPHFLAIALYRKNDYQKAGTRVVPLTHGDAAARTQAKIFTGLLLVVSLLLGPFGGVGWTYLAVAGGLGVWLLASAGRFLNAASAASGARRFFFATLIYLPALIFGLVIDLVLR